MALKWVFRPENDVYKQIPSIEVAEARFYRFSEIFFQIARHFFEKCVILAAYISRSGASQRLKLPILNRKKCHLHAVC